MTIKNHFQRAAICGLTFAALFAPTASWSAEGKLRVVIAVIDSLMPHEICGPAETRCAVKTPNLHALKEMGTWYEESRSVFSAETIPNHVAMITGRYPEFNGIPTNKYWNRISGAGEFEGDLALPSELEAPTLFRLIRGYPVGEGAACPDMITASVMSKDYLYNIFSACDFTEEQAFGGETCLTDGAPPPPQTQAHYHWLAPFFIPESGHILDPFTIQASRAFLGDSRPTTGLPEDPGGIFGAIFSGTSGILPSETGGDYTQEPAQTEPENRTADFMFINMGDVDRLGHSDPTGSVPQALNFGTDLLPIPIIPTGFDLPSGRDGAIVDADVQIGELVGSLGYDLTLGQVTDERWNNTVLFITSDHGMDWKEVSENYTGVDLSEEIAVGFPEGGMREVANAGTTGLYIETPTAVMNWQKAAEVHAEILSNIAEDDGSYPAEFAYFVYDPVQKSSLTGLSEASFNGLTIGESGTPTLDYIRANLIPGESVPPGEEGNNLGLAKHENLGDIIVSAKLGSAYGSPLPGNHGHRTTLHNTMLVSGGLSIVRKGNLVTADGAPTSETDAGPGYTSTVSHLWRGTNQSENIDIGATAAWLLGVLSEEEIKQQMDGRILTEAFDLSQPLPTPGSCGNVAEWAFVSVDEARELSGETSGTGTGTRTSPRCKGCKVESNRQPGDRPKPRCKGCKVEKR